MLGKRLCAGRPGTLVIAGHAGQLGAAYFILVVIVPALMITHTAAFYFSSAPLREVGW